MTRRGLVRLLVVPLGLIAVVQLSAYAYDQKYMLVVLAGLLALFGLARDIPCATTVPPSVRPTGMPNT